MHSTSNQTAAICCRRANAQLQALHSDACQAAARGQVPQEESSTAASTLGLLLSMLRFALGSGPQQSADDPASVAPALFLHAWVVLCLVLLMPVDALHGMRPAVHGAVMICKCFAAAQPGAV